MSKPFTDFTGIAAPLCLSNVDTDKIIPARFLKTVTRHGLGNGLFHALRFDAHGQEIAEFILNREPWRRASILVALENFGCGSSREHAPWALHDYGIRCIIAHSFADIFYNNCFRNGILPIVVGAQPCSILIHDASTPSTAPLSIRLLEQVIVRSNGERLPFELDPNRQRQLSLGLDEIDATLAREAEIIAFEAHHVDARIPELPADSDGRTPSTNFWRSVKSEGS